MDIQEYLLSYGSLGDFGRFRPLRRLTCRRGARAIIRSHRGLEIGEVLCVARPGHAHFLPNTTVGQLLNLATDEEERLADQMRQRAQQIFEDARSEIVALSLPMQVLDVEVLLDGQQAYVHFVRAGECDVRPLVSGLSRRHEIQIVLEDLTSAPSAEEQGCGEPNCGKKEGGGCSTCSTGGGCSSCGSATAKDTEAKLIAMRQKIEEKRRVALL